MPRRTSSSSHMSSSPSSSQPHHFSPVQSKPSSHPPIVTQQQNQYQYPSIGEIVKQGFGFGIGSSLANRVVASVLGPTHHQSQPIQVSSQETKREPVHSIAYNQCVLEGGNHEVCKQYLDDLK